MFLRCYLTLSLLCIVAAGPIQAQDQIFLRDSSVIYGKVLRAGRDTVVYILKDSLQESTSKIATTRINSIVYESGTTSRYFTGQPKASTSIALDSQGLANQKTGANAALDASRNTRTFPGGKVAGALAFFLTPVGGLLPATAIALVTPPKRRWTTFDSTYAHDKTYVRSYRKEIRKEKQRYTLGQYKQGAAVFWAFVVLGASAWAADRLFR
jgi:hypothetical protein